MAELVKLDSFKRGDTPTFRFGFSDPYPEYDWSGTTIDCTLTSVITPNDNAGAAALRLAQALTDDPNGVHYAFTLTVIESKALTVGATYKVEAQLKQGSDMVATPVTATVKVIQDYVI